MSNHLSKVLATASRISTRRWLKFGALWNSGVLVYLANRMAELITQGVFVRVEKERYRLVIPTNR